MFDDGIVQLNFPKAAAKTTHALTFRSSRKQFPVSNHKFKIGRHPQPGQARRAQINSYACPYMRMRQFKSFHLSQPAIRRSPSPIPSRAFELANAPGPSPSRLLRLARSIVRLGSDHWLNASLCAEEMARHQATTLCSGGRTLRSETTLVRDVEKRAAGLAMNGI